MAKKYKKGETIHMLDLLFGELTAGRWVYYRDRPLHPGFIQNMTFNTVLGGLRAGNFAIAKER